MQGLKDFFERIKMTWDNMTGGKKAALISLGAAFIISLTVYYFVFGKTTYVPLFSDLSDTDSGKIVQKLDELGTDYRLEMGGTTVSVPESIVDKLRISLANEGALPASGVGFELFDKSSFTLTSEDREIMYQRALQGELQRAIMALEEVDFATVILSMPQDSLFASEKESGSASILLRLNAFKKLSSEKVRGIVALVSGAVKGIPSENVQVIDTELNYLSFGVTENNNFNSIQETGNRFGLKQEFEDTLASELQGLLEGALGRGKVLVKVNADMNFDTEESTMIAYNDESPV
ncbi:MAG: flagellar M-ring protein FliF, partial [Clostridia bacterium]|nr:flagellar M-ring protein FliF [Clostridia bacterium]